MPDYHNAEQTSLDAVGEHERFLLHNKREISTELVNLSKKPDILTAYFNAGSEFILTAVLGVLNERGLVVLDVGPDDAITQRAIGSGKLVCTTRSNGVPVKFTCTQLRLAKFQGQPAIAAAIPDSLFRLQRREYFRVQVPRIHSPSLLVQLADERELALKVLDLGLGGLCLVDTEGGFRPNLLEQYHRCRLSLPEYGDLQVDIQIRNEGQYRHGKELLPRYGASFLSLGAQENMQLQRYLYQLQTLVTNNG